jgi:hypothetical protein
LPGSGLKFTTTGSSKDTNLALYTNRMEDPVPSFAISVRADPANSTSTGVFNLGRGAAYEPFYADDSRTFYSCQMQELILNDLGSTTAIFYVDISGPMDPRAQYVTTVPALQWSGRKGPNDPTP